MLCHKQLHSILSLALLALLTACGNPSTDNTKQPEALRQTWLHFAYNEIHPELSALEIHRLLTEQAFLPVPCTSDRAEAPSLLNPQGNEDVCYQNPDTQDLWHIFHRDLVDTPHALSSTRLSLRQLRYATASEATIKKANKEFYEQTIERLGPPDFISPTEDNGGLRLAYWFVGDATTSQDDAPPEGHRFENSLQITLNTLQNTGLTMTGSDTGTE